MIMFYITIVLSFFLSFTIESAKSQTIYLLFTSKFNTNDAIWQI